MRSVFAFMSDVAVSGVRSWLDGVAVATKPDGWRWPEEGTGTLFPGLDEGCRYVDREDVTSATAALGKKPAFVVQVDVSGRLPGNVEVLQFLTELMTAFPAVAQDEHTSHCWTLEELSTEAKFEGRGFFDTEDWQVGG